MLWIPDNNSRAELLVWGTEVSNMGMHKIITYVKGTSVFIATSLLLLNQVHAENFAPRTCEEYENDLSAVDQYIRARLVPTDPTHTPSPTMAIGALEEERGKLLAQRALLEGIEMLRQRHVTNMAYLNNQKNCELTYETKADQDECHRTPTTKPAKSFFEIQDAKTLGKLNTKIETAKTDATNVYGMEQTIQNLLGTRSELNSLLASTTPPADGALVSRLVAKCSAVTTPSSNTGVNNVCAILKGQGGAANFNKLSEVLNSFGKAFYYGYRYKNAGASSAEKVTANDQARAALASFKTRLTEAPLTGGTALLGTITALNNFGDTIKKRQRKALDCANRTARGMSLGSGTSDDQVSADITASEEEGTGEYSGTHPRQLADQLDVTNPGGRVCEPTSSERGADITEERKLRRALRTSLAIVDPPNGSGPESGEFSLAADHLLRVNALVSLSSLSDQSPVGSHMETLQKWLRNQADYKAHKDQAVSYLFDENTADKTANTALTRESSDPGRPSSQGDNLRAVLVQTANRAMYERKLNGSGPGRNVAPNDTMTMADVYNDSKLARHFLKQMKLYQADLMGGSLISKCPNPELMGEGKIDQADEAAIFTALHSCLKEITAASGTANDLSLKKTAINARLAILNAANPESGAVANRPDINYARMLKGKLARLAKLKCGSTSLVCKENGRRSLDNVTGDTSLGYLLNASGNVLARLAPNDIVASGSEASLRSEIASVCKESFGLFPENTATTLRAQVGNVCSAHDPFVRVAISGNTTEYSAESQIRTNQRLENLSNTYTTFLPNGDVATSTPAASFGSLVAPGLANAGVILIGTWGETMSIESNTSMLTAGVQNSIYWNSMNDAYMKCMSASISGICAPIGYPMFTNPLGSSALPAGFAFQSQGVGGISAAESSYYSFH